MNGTGNKNHRKSSAIIHYTFQVPPIPKSEWCDFRIDYESGMTLIEIAQKYYCDPRTVRACIVHNKPSYMLGRHSVSTKLAPYCSYIDDYLVKAGCKRNTKIDRLNISAITRDIFHTIQDLGYSGCERTIRNYIGSKVSPKKTQDDKEEQR